MKPIVFIIDSDQKIRSMVKFQLEQEGLFLIQDFHSVEESLYQIRKDIKPDYVILTLETGLHPVQRFITSLLTINPLCRIIFFSHFDHPEDAELLLAWGATDYIAKTGDSTTNIRMLVRNLVYLYRVGTGLQDYSVSSSRSN